jgi:hypothetical protein
MLLYVRAIVRRVGTQARYCRGAKTSYHFVVVVQHSRDWDSAASFIMLCTADNNTIILLLLFSSVILFFLCLASIWRNLNGCIVRTKSGNILHEKKSEKTKQKIVHVIDFPKNFDIRYGVQKQGWPHEVSDVFYYTSATPFLYSFFQKPFYMHSTFYTICVTAQ